jgi:hypothetical protein
VSTKLGISVQTVPLAEANPEARRLAEYWQARRAGRVMPVRRDLDAVEMRAWLGRLSLYEFLSDGDMLCRLRGSTVATIPMPGHDSDGVRVSLMKPQDLVKVAVHQFTDSFGLAAPTYHAFELGFDGLSCRYERLVLPLASDGVLRPMVLTFVKCDVLKARSFWEEYRRAGLELTD